jgi:hypothetical protein
MNRCTSGDAFSADIRSIIHKWHTCKGTGRQNFTSGGLALGLGGKSLRPPRSGTLLYCAQPLHELMHLLERSPFSSKAVVITVPAGRGSESQEEMSSPVLAHTGPSVLLD